MNTFYLILVYLLLLKNVVKNEIGDVKSSTSNLDQEELLPPGPTTLYDSMKVRIKILFKKINSHL
jgi:hypothetical protein